MILLAALVILLVPNSIASTTSSAQNKEVRRVLIFDDFNPLASPGIRLINQAIFTGLQSSPYQIEFYTENLEATLFADEVYQRQIRDWFFRKYHDRKPDVIIVVGPASLQFMIESHDSFATNVPIIFCGSTQEMVESLNPGSEFTGVWGVAQPEKTLEAALHLQPFTQHVVIVGGIGTYDRKLETITRESLRKYEGSFEFTFLTDLDMPTLLERVRHLPNNTIIYYTAITEDGAGTHFIDATQSVPKVAAAANAPMFIVDDVDLGTGAVGGDVLSLAAEGHTAARMAIRVLNGEKPENIPAVKSTNIYMFDALALRRWGFRESNLPPGSVVLNRRLSVWESAKWYLIGGASLIVAEGLLIFGLLWQRSRRRKAEAELALTHDRLRLAVESGKSASWDWEIKTGQNRWFGDLNTMFGIPSDHYVGRAGDLRKYVHPEDRGLVEQAIENSRKSRNPYVAEFRVIRSDQTVRWISARGKFYHGKNGDPELMLGMAVDITDRKQMEQKVRESEQRLEGIIGSAMDAIVAVDEEQRIVLFNSAAESIFRCPAGEAIGKKIDRFIPQRFRSDHKEHIQRFGRAGIPNGPMRIANEVRGLRANGEEFPIEASVAQVQTDGKKLFTVILRDMTQRLEAEKAVQESERRFRLVANTAPVMIWMSGTDKLCTYFNDPWLDFTGRPVDAELGNGWAEGVHAEDLRRCLDTYTRAFDLREKFEMQYRIRRHDGEYRWVLDVGVPRFNPDGSFAGYIGSCMDVTDRKIAEEALATVGRRLIEAHEEERTRIGRELHDDINQRITLALIELDLLRQKLPRGSGFEDQLQRVRDRIAEIGYDVQALSHRLHCSHLEYLGLATAAESFCNEVAEKQKVEIEFRHSCIPSKIPKEVALSLFRVLQEAVQNAVKHSGVRHFKAELRGRPDGIELSVSDEGTGFNQREAVRSAGLGLISMRERVQLVNGEFSIDSKPGCGTTIHARVPLTEREFRAGAA